MRRIRVLRSVSMLGLSMLSIFTVAAVNAQSTDTTTSIYVPNINPQMPDFLQPIVSRGLGLLYAIGWIVLIAAGIYGAIELARGDSEKGKKALGGAIIGAIILAILPLFIKWLLGG